MINLLRMAIQWARLQRNITHFFTALFSYFWMEYILDATFRHHFWMYIHNLPVWMRGIIGFLISFSMWYHNPIKQKLNQKEMENYEKTHRSDYGSGLGSPGNNDGAQSDQHSDTPSAAD